MQVRGRNSTHLLCALFLLVAGFVLAAPAIVRAQTVGEVVVDGAQRIDPDTIRSYVLIKAGDQATPDDVARIRATLGLDRPFLVRFWEWSWQILHGDLGTSIFTNLPVTTMIGQRVEPTVSLMLVTLVFAILVAVPLGLLIGRYRVLDLLTADYTFVDERLAKHYGIPGVTGARFRKVPVTDPNRRGLFGHGSILALTSATSRPSQHSLATVTRCAVSRPS